MTNPNEIEVVDYEIVKPVLSKILLMISIFVISSCSQPESPTQSADCNCDRVKEVNVFSIIGTPQNPQTTYHCVYTTINECSGVQKQKTFDTYNPDNVPQINQCR